MTRSLTRSLFALAFLVLTARVHAAEVQCMNPNTVKRYVPCRIDLALTNPPAGSLYDTTLQVWATFTHATAPPVTVYGFLLSGTTFRFRFNPTTEGTWNYTFHSSSGDIYVTNLPGQSFFAPASTRERGFTRRESSISGNPDRVVYDCAFDGPNQCPPESTPASPISAPNGVDHPLLWGMTYYQIINNAATKNANGMQSTSWQTAITSAKAKGFRKIRMLVYPWDGAYNGTYTIGGIPNVPAARSAPYVLTNGCTADKTQINLEHFNTLDQIINYMHTQGMGAELIVFKDQDLDPVNGMDCGQTFFGAPYDERYARYVFSRYAAYPNVTFSMTNEYEGTVYSPAQWNTLAEALKPYDPFRVHPRTNLLRLIGIHQHERKFPDPGFHIAYSPTDLNWMVHASLQWSKYGGNYPGSTALPDAWGEEVRATNDPLDIPLFDDEYGYLGNFDSDGTSDAQLRHRQAMWGLALAGVYASDGDTRTVPNMTFKSEWPTTPEPPEWSDFQRMVKFFTDPAAQVPIPEYWRLRRALYSNQSRRAWVAADSNKYIVVYDAIGVNAWWNITFTLPGGLPSGQTWDTWRYDPVTGNYSAQTDLSNRAGGTSLTIPRGNEFAHDTVFLLKSQL